MMPDGDVTSDNQRVCVVCHVQHAQILNVGPVSDPDVVHIASHYGMEPDTALFAHLHVADHDAGVLDKAGGGNRRFDTLERPNHGRTIGESACGCKTLFDRLFHRPVDCSA
jgi:hypothetical protein